MTLGRGYKLEGPSLLRFDGLRICLTIHVSFISLLCQLETRVPILCTVVDRFIIRRYTTKINQWLSNLAWDVVTHVPLP